MNKTIAVWFSCGAASAVAAKKTIELYGDRFDIRVLNNPVAEEHEDNLRFLKDVETWIGVPIESVTNNSLTSTSANDIWQKNSFMASPYGAPCTRELKKKARQQWEIVNDFDYIVLGFTADEQKRHDSFIAIEPYPVLPVLIDLQITKPKCFTILSEANIEIPHMYKLGFPNANCIGCVKATSPTYWNKVRQEFPAVFEDRAELSRKIGCRLVRYKGKRIFLDELPDTAQGRKMKSYDCGSFCDSGKRAGS